MAGGGQGNIGPEGVSRQIENYLAGLGGANSPNDTSSRDSGLSMDGENAVPGGFPQFPGGFPGFSGFSGFPGFPGLNPGFPGLNPAFAGFQNGFSSPTGLPGGFCDPVSQAANSGFLSGGNIDFSKMESLVRNRFRQKV